MHVRRNVAGYVDGEETIEFSNLIKDIHIYIYSIGKTVSQQVLIL
jgi:hypothetical protein